MAYLHKRKTGVYVLIDKSINKWITLGKIAHHEAKTVLRRYETDNTYLKLDLPVPPCKIPFKELCEEYLEHAGSYKAASTVAHEKEALNLIARDFGEITIDKVTVQTASAAINKTKFKPNTAHYRAKVLRNCLKYACEKKYINKNVVDEIKLPPLTQLPPKAVDPEIIEKIFKHLRGAPLAYYTILYYTGLRPGEAIKLTKKDIDFKNKVIMVNSTKTGRFRSIPIHEKALKHLKDLNFISLRGMVTALKRACRDAKVDQISPYVYRHTFATQVLAKTANLRAVQTLLGHSRSTMTERYAHVLDDQLRDAVGKL